MMSDTILAGLAALPCPAICPGTEPWLNNAMKALVTQEEAKSLFPENGEPARFVILKGRRFAVMHAEGKAELLLLAEQFSGDEEPSAADTLEMRLRNTLACSVLAAKLLARETPEGRGRSYLAEIRKNMAQIERICDDLRTAHIREMDGIRLCSIETLVRELFDKANYYLPEEKRVAYRFEEGRADIYCAPALIEAMLLDLTAELLARGDRENRVSLTVSPGDRPAIHFAAEHLGEFSSGLEAMLFEKAGEGTGFEAVRRVVTLHKGSLYVKKQGADGAVITVTLPRGTAVLQVYQSVEKYQGYDYVRMMLSDILEREDFLEGGERRT